MAGRFLYVRHGWSRVHVHSARTSIEIPGFLADAVVDDSRPVNDGGVIYDHGGRPMVFMKMAGLDEHKRRGGDTD